MLDKFTESGRNVMAFAHTEARRFNHEYVGPEHILLGILKHGDNLAATLLLNQDISLIRIRVETERLLKSGPNALTIGEIPLTASAKGVIKDAFDEARQLGSSYVGPEHLFLGLLSEKHSLAATALANAGVDLQLLHDDIQKSLYSPPAIPDPSATLTRHSAPMIFEYAADEARNLGHKRVENGHVFLGLLRDTDGAAIQVLSDLGVKVEDVRVRLLQRLGDTPRA